MSVNNYKGIPGVIVIWHGEWADPEVEYNGIRVNLYDLENEMMEMYKDEFFKESIDDEEDFTKYCQENADFVKNLIEYNIWN